jgi:hypothetical protein
MKHGIVCVLLAMSGCAGALGVYVPGSGNKSGQWQGGKDLGNGLVEVHTYDYSIGDNGFGVALGAKVDASWASVGGKSLDKGLANEAHADLSYCHGRFGGIFEVAFGSDRGTTTDMKADEIIYGGLSLGLVAQAIVIPRIAVHLGVHKLLTGGVQVGEADSVAAHGFRIEPGVDLTAYRGEKNEFIFRFDLRHTRSGEVSMGTTDLSFVGNAILAELVWVSTP